jgi:hypothetical protein
LILAREPHAAERVARALGREADVVAVVDHLAIRVAAAVGDPHAAERLHHRVERNGDAAGVPHPLDLVAFAFAVVRVRLAVRHHDEAAVGEVGAHPFGEIGPGRALRALAALLGLDRRAAERRSGAGSEVHGPSSAEMLARGSPTPEWRRFRVQIDGRSRLGQE